MRRSDRAVTDPARLIEILDQCKILRLAMQDEDGLYIVPLNFGYTRDGERLSFYIHSAKEGRKVSAMAAGCEVAFEADCRFQLQEAELACKYSCAYASLIGTGHARPVEDPAEKALGLSAIMKHQTGQDFTFTEAQTEPVAVFRIDVQQMTGKEKQ